MPKLTLPPHKYGLTIEHITDFDTDYGCCSVEEWVDDTECESEYRWKDEYSKQMAIKLQSIWTIEYYPYSRDTCYRLASYSLPALLDYAKVGEY